MVNEDLDKSEAANRSASMNEFIQCDSYGVYRCAACSKQLFNTGVTFDPDTGWPNFDEALPGAVRFEKDTKCSMECIEISCAGCTAYLGHMFLEGVTEIGKRYCMKSVCIEIEIDQ